MELESMFTEQKWNILECLSQGKYSPLQLAEKLNTTMANVSQQLRLLEASNLVQKEKIKNRDRGKPRTLFSLSTDHAYLISAMQNFAHKKMLDVTPHKKAILRIWFLEDSILQRDTEKLYLNLEPNLNAVHLLSINPETKQALLASENMHKIQHIVNKSNLEIRLVSVEESRRLLKNKSSPFFSENLVSIYERKDN